MITTVFIMAISAGVGIVALSIYYWNKVNGAWFGVVVGLCLILVQLSLLFAYFFDRGYRAGQIDAARGIQKWALVERANGEKRWSETQPGKE